MRPTHLFDDLSAFESAIHAFLQQSPIIQSSYHLIHHLPRTSILPTLPPPNASDPNTETTISPINAVYNHLLRTRLNSLPSEIPNRVRLRRERLARSIAINHFLSSLGLSIIPTPEAVAPPPLRPTQMSSQYSSQPQYSQSQFSQDTQDPFSSSQPSEPPEPLLRIRTYAPIQTRIVLSSGLQNVLDSWHVGEDPNNLKFNANADEGVPRYRRDRMKERKEKEEKRARREREKEMKREARRAERAASMVSQMSGMSFGGSQPAPKAGIGASQMMPMSQEVGGGLGSSQLPAIQSQVERGKHGARPVVKKRRKGF